MKKFITASVLVLCLTLFLSGCKKNEPTFLNATEVNSENLWQISYESFNGIEEREVELIHENGLIFSIELITNSGKLTLSILDSDGELLYQGSRQGAGGNSPSSFQVGAKVPGKYIIRIEGNNHSGSIDIKWD